jgi:hypothetical protein
VKGVCPVCGNETLERVGGEWCPRCRGWVTEIRVHRGEDDAAHLRLIESKL